MTTVLPGGRVVVDIPIEIVAPKSEADIETAKALFLEYAQSLGLGHQDFESEMADFPGTHAPPGARCCWPRLGASLRRSGQMRATVRLYRSLGFVDIPAYYPSPIPGTAYMEPDL